MRLNVRVQYETYLLTYLKHEYYKEQDSKRKSTEYQKVKCRERNATET